MKPRDPATNSAPLGLEKAAMVPPRNINATAATDADRPLILAKETPADQSAIEPDISHELGLTDEIENQTSGVITSSQPHVIAAPSERRELTSKNMAAKESAAPIPPIAILIAYTERDKSSPTKWWAAQ
jgi:hypothetical protein